MAALFCFRQLVMPHSRIRSHACSPIEYRLGLVENRFCTTDRHTSKAVRVRLRLGLDEYTPYTKRKPIIDLFIEYYEPRCKMCKMSSYTQIPLGSSCLDSTRLDTFDMSSGSRRACRPCRAVLFRHGGRRTSYSARLYKFSRFYAFTYTNPICIVK